jgi:hypothetical protein
MNYKWITKEESGQYEIGFVDVYMLEYNKNAISIIHYIPQFKVMESQVVDVTLILEGKKNDWTDGEIKGILTDMSDYVVRNEKERFKFLNNLNYINTQMFYMSKITEFELLNHGDYFFR